MPRFFIEVSHDGRVWADVEGSELPDLAAARAEAIGSMFQLGQISRLDKQHHAFEARVLDTAGRVVFTAEMEVSLTWRTPPNGKFVDGI